MHNLRLSRYAKVVPSGEDVLLVGLRLRTVVETSKDSLAALERSLAADCVPEHLEGLVEALLAAGILVPSDLDELDDVIARTLAARAQNDVLAAVISPTIACNMRCHYCFQSRTDTTSMGDATARGVVGYLGRLLKERASGRLHVRWFGGEPLTCLETMAGLTASLRTSAREANASYSADLVTNGTLLDRATAQICAELNIRSAQVTLDGDTETHDRVRRGPEGGSFDRILENVLAASDLVRIRVRIHVAPYNQSEVPALLERMAARGLAAVVEHVYFAPLFNYKQRGRGLPFADDGRLYLTSEVFSQAQVHLLRHAHQLGFQTPDPLDSDYGVCTALRENTVVVNPDGSLAKCYLDAGDDHAAFAHVESGLRDASKLQQWRRSLFANDSDCRSCEFAPVCLGGCRKQTLSGADKAVVCTPLRFNLPELVRLYHGAPHQDSEH